MSTKLAAAAMAEMDAQRIDVVGLDGEQWATGEVIDGLGTAGPKGVVRFLPVWDAWLMNRRERSRVVAEAHRPCVVDRSGNVTNTVTLDGRVIGVWDEDGQTLLVALHDGVAPAGLEDAAARLRPVVPWTDIELAKSRVLPDEKQIAFRAPLKAGPR